MRRLAEANIPLDGASDHGVSEALYLRDPDENGVELYWDRPREAWPRTPDGELSMFTHHLDLRGLLAAAPPLSRWRNGRGQVSAVRLGSGGKVVVPHKMV